MNISQIISDLDKKGRYAWVQLSSNTYGKVKIAKSQGVYYCLEKDGYKPLIVTAQNIPISGELSFTVVEESKVFVKDERKKLPTDDFYSATE